MPLYRIRKNAASFELAETEANIPNCSMERRNSREYCAGCRFGTGSPEVSERRGCYTAFMTALYRQMTRALLKWYEGNQRSFPFRGTRNPYFIWVSEMMLQQTRTETVGAYYLRFIQRFPTVGHLARATQEEVLSLWAGLGYYSRARNLHRAAEIVETRYGGQLPTDRKELRSLPGIGPYTAAAIASIAFGEPVAAMDGNLTRVISRLFCVREEVNRPSVRTELLGHAQLLIPRDRPGDMNQALMDLGATLCLPGLPGCARCPLKAWCLARREGAPESLPLVTKKKSPLEVPVGLILLTCGNRILLRKRQETLLKGMYVFVLCEGDASQAGAERLLKELGVQAQARAHLGRTRHVFTHRVWEMDLHHFETGHEHPVRDGLWADRASVRSLPLPAAMRKAAEFADAILATGRQGAAP